MAVLPTVGRQALSGALTPVAVFCPCVFAGFLSFSAAEAAVSIAKAIEKFRIEN